MIRESDDDDYEEVKKTTKVNGHKSASNNSQPSSPKQKANKPVQNEPINLLANNIHASKKKAATTATTPVKNVETELMNSISEVNSSYLAFFINIILKISFYIS